MGSVNPMAVAFPMVKMTQEAMRPLGNLIPKPPDIPTAIGAAAVPTIAEARMRRQAQDALTRKRGRVASMVSGGTESMAAPQKTLVGS